MSLSQTSQQLFASWMNLHVVNRHAKHRAEPSQRRRLRQFFSFCFYYLLSCTWEIKTRDLRPFTATFPPHFVCFMYWIQHTLCTSNNFSRSQWFFYLTQLDFLLLPPPPRLRFQQRIFWFYFVVFSSRLFSLPSSTVTRNE